eukprot:2507298-Prymnesium_polylepis.1
MPIVPNASEGIVRRKYGYFFPSLSVGLVDDGETTGTCEPAATSAAVTDAPEHPAPIITFTPRPSNASRVRCNAAVRAWDESHFESLYANSKRVWGRRASCTPSLLLLISRSAW